MSRIGLGTLRLALGRSVPPPEESIALLRRAVELGVVHLDTAGNYGYGLTRAHELIRAALHPYPGELTIATKIVEPDPARVRGAVESDRRRLGVDRLDLVYLRADRAGEALGERFEVLAGLRDEGLIRDLGVSNVDTAQLDEARGVAPVAAVQNQFHIHDRGGADVLARCEKEGITYVPFFPLGGGGTKIDASRLAKTAARHGATPAQVALAWLLAVSPVTLPIPGTTDVDHLAENVAAAGLRLTAADLEELG